MHRVLLALALLFAPALCAERIVLVAGGTEARADAPATQVKLMEPFGVDFDAADNLFIVEMVSGNRLLRLVFYTPAVLPLVSVASIWGWLYNPQYGAINASG